MNWEQFRAILWLRWRLSHNQLTRLGKMGAVIATLATALLVVLAVTAGVAGVLAGVFALKKATADTLMLTWDSITFGMLFFTLLGVMTELQRSESVDLTRLLHLPISLKQVFVFNYLASLISVGTVLGITAMLGLALGLAISHGGSFLLAMPLAMTFVFMVTAWVYCLRGWLLSFMVNPRRRREIIMWMSLAIILVSQAPQLVNLAWQRQARAEREARRIAQQSAKKEAPVDAPKTDAQPKAEAKPPKTNPVLAMATNAHSWVPVLWMANGVRGLATGQVFPALWGSLGMFGLGWLGLHRAYRATLKFYRSDEPIKLNAAAAVKVDASPGKPAANWVARRLPWLAEDTAALALAQFRSMTRASEIRMMLAMGVFMSIFLPMMMFFSGGKSKPTPEVFKPFMGTGMMVFVLFFLLQLVCNQFGCDRDAFRGFVLLPTRRDKMLLGKNLALFPLATFVALLPLTVLAFTMRLSPVIILATFLQFIAAFLMYCALGNLTSILLPYRIAAGSLKPTKQSWRTMVGMMLMTLSFPFLILPVFVPPLLGYLASRFTSWPGEPINLVATVGMMGVLGVVYALTLRPLGKFLQRRETTILRAVTEVTE